MQSRPHGPICKRPLMFDEQRRLPAASPQCAGMGSRPARTVSRRGRATPAAMSLKPAITAPVLFAMGERDVVPDPKGEPRAFMSSRSVDLFVFPRTGHVHLFAGTRELAWHGIATWADS